MTFFLVDVSPIGSSLTPCDDIDAIVCYDLIELLYFHMLLGSFDK